MRKRIGEEYLRMSDKQLRKLPEFEGDGIKLYKVGKLLLGKRALIRFVESNRPKLVDSYKHGNAEV